MNSGAWYTCPCSLPDWEDPRLYSASRQILGKQREPVTHPSNCTWLLPNSWNSADNTKHTDGECYFGAQLLVVFLIQYPAEFRLLNRSPQEPRASPGSPHVSTHPSSQGSERDTGLLAEKRSDYFKTCVKRKGVKRSREGSFKKINK